MFWDDLTTEYSIGIHTLFGHWFSSIFAYPFVSASVMFSHSLSYSSSKRKLPTVCLCYNLLLLVQKPLKFQFFACLTEASKLLKQWRKQKRSTWWYWINLQNKFEVMSQVTAASIIPFFFVAQFHHCHELLDFFFYG